MPHLPLNAPTSRKGRGSMVCWWGHKLQVFRTRKLRVEAGLLGGVYPPWGHTVWHSLAPGFLLWASNGPMVTVSVPVPITPHLALHLLPQHLPTLLFQEEEKDPLRRFAAWALSVSCCPPLPRAVLFPGLAEKEEKSERKRKIFHLLILLPHLKELKWPGVGQVEVKELGTSSGSPTEVARFQALEPIFCFFPRCVSRELAQKWNRQDLNQCPYSVLMPQVAV